MPAAARVLRMRASEAKPYLIHPALAASTKLEERIQRPDPGPFFLPKLAMRSFVLYFHK